MESRDQNSLHWVQVSRLVPVGALAEFIALGLGVQVGPLALGALTEFIASVPGVQGLGIHL